MKRTLWTFGDSFTESFSDNKAIWLDKYIDWKGYIPKVYGEVISEEMGINLVNLGKGGTDNYSIFQSVCDSVHRINSNDVIIIGWSSTIRFRLVDNLGRWKPIIPVFDRNAHNLENVSNNTLEEILLNRDSEVYKNEVRSWIKLLNHTFQNNLLIHWSWVDNSVAPNYFGNIATIQTETNGTIDDGHYCEKGHIQLAKEFMDMISTNKNRRLI
jgi:lysophospholipase L1-like esterase